MSFRRLLSLALLLLVIATPAWSHTKSESHTEWRIAGRVVHLTFTVPDIEAKRIARSGEDAPSNQELGQYLAERVGAAAGAAACTPAPPRPITSTAGFRRLEFTFDCPPDGPISLHSAAFFDLVPSHVTFVQIVNETTGQIAEQLITQDHQTLDASGGSENRLQNAGFLEYVLMGIMHIFTGVDHQSFLLGLVLISPRLRDLVFVVTGFTLGHSVTLALAVTGIIRPHAEFIDALIGLTILLIGAENIVAATHKPAIVALAVLGMLATMALGSLLGFGGLPALLLLGAGLFAANYLMVSGHLRDAARLRLVVTLVFGLIHGFGFAADLLEMKLPAGRLAELLVGFNLGVEVGQLSLVMVMLGIAWLLARMRLALPRPIVVDVASAGLVAFGLFLFVTRGYA